MAVYSSRICWRHLDGDPNWAYLPFYLNTRACTHGTNTSGERTHREDGRTRDDGYERIWWAISLTVVEWKRVYSGQPLLCHGVGCSLDRYRPGTAHCRGISRMGSKLILASIFLLQ